MNTHGGKRRNSGRKKSGRKPYLIRVKPKTMATIRSEARSVNKTPGELLDWTFDERLRDWQDIAQGYREGASQ